ncbi:MAG: hypothetical protein H6R24_165 [Proteobacteria bacterium]|nr:hypothetical protein [Pseudomonadota bacterium]
MAVGTMASPSNPSVRLTALLEPTMTKYASGIKSQPRFRATFLKNGTINWVSTGAWAVKYSSSAAARPAPD